MFCKVTDQLDRIIELAALPQRIISLVPSQTELLVDLGLKERLVGITRFCIHPAGITDEIKVVGGTKKIVRDRLYELQPDLIICNKEENTPEIVAFCDQIAPTYISDVNTLEQAREMIIDLGTLTGTSFKAKSMARNIKMRFDGMPAREKKRALYLIWKDPYMGVGEDTFIDDIMSKSGFENALESSNRYPELTLNAMVKLQPDVIFLSSEPFPFKETHIEEISKAFTLAKPQHAVKPNVTPEIRLVDGEMFSWYGSRLLKAPEYLQTL
jgi:ABC-type Fe3+-hydroxamate transport system substrate-binding protein